MMIARPAPKARDAKLWFSHGFAKSRAHYTLPGRNETRSSPMAMTMKDKTAVSANQSAWPQSLHQEFEREARAPNGCVRTW